MSGTKAETSKDETVAPVCRWCGKTIEDHVDAYAPGEPAPRVGCGLLKENFSPNPKPQPEFTPRRLVVVTGHPRGEYLADADTGEDLRLPIQSIRVHWASQKSHADCSFIIERAEKWVPPTATAQGENDA